MPLTKAVIACECEKKIKKDLDFFVALGRRQSRNARRADLHAAAYRYGQKTGEAIAVRVSSHSRVSTI